MMRSEEKFLPLQVILELNQYIASRSGRHEPINQKEAFIIPFTWPAIPFATGFFRNRDVTNERLRLTKNVIQEIEKLQNPSADTIRALLEKLEKDNIALNIEHGKYHATTRQKGAIGWRTVFQSNLMEAIERCYRLLDPPKQAIGCTSRS